MAFKQEIRELFSKGHLTHLRNISVDCIILGFDGSALKVLLLNARYADGWALPSGIIRLDEDIDATAVRVLRERTGLDNIYLHQFKAFGKADRATQAVNRKVLSSLGIRNEKSWLFERFVTVGYYALVDFNKIKPKGDDFSHSQEWHNVYELPELMMDHGELVAAAIADLRLQLNYRPIGLSLLPNAFTMPELQKLFEAILNRKLDRRNFQRKILAMDILKRVTIKNGGNNNKAAYYYKFDARKYQKALSAGLGFQL